MESTAFEAARAICKRHARSFYFSSFFLPKPKRDAAYAVYAFCRLLDDATDEAPDATAVEKQITRFCELLGKIYAGESADFAVASDEARLALQAFAWTVKQYQIPRKYFDEVAEGCRMDLTIHRYQTWEDLRQYCYRVAGVVGLIMCKIFGLNEPAAEAQAVMMGEAMQLTNILRDVKEDFARGRIYLPLEDLQRFGYTERDLADGVVNDCFRDLMKFQVERARMLFQTGAAGLRHLPNDGSRFTATAMGVIYAGILRAIERQKYDVFSNRARLNLPQKLLRLPAAWRVSHRTGESTIPRVF
jgi:15-cis-phytoene synthase